MQKVRVREAVFGDGNPRIAVSIIGNTEEEIIEHVKSIMAEARRLEAEYEGTGLKVDILEFRADYYENLCNKVLLRNLLEEIRALIDDRILLFTFRSEEEGGEFRHDRAGGMLEDIYEWVINTGCVDMIDVELMSGGYKVARKIEKAHEKDVAVVLSYHNFDHTPHNEKLLDIFKKMEIFGGDILKIATMPKNDFDVRRILELTEIVTGKRTDIKRPIYESIEGIDHPIVMISMGSKGRRTRTDIRKTGSAFTFASGTKASAPGQLSIEELFGILAEEM